MEIRRRPPSPKIRVSYLEYGVPLDNEEPRNILEKIVWEKDREVELAREKVPLDQLKKKIGLLPPTKDFIAALKRAQVKPAVIAEVKKPAQVRELSVMISILWPLRRPMPQGGQVAYPYSPISNFFRVVLTCWFRCVKPLICPCSAKNLF